MSLTRLDSGPEHTDGLHAYSVDLDVYGTGRLELVKASGKVASLALTLNGERWLGCSDCRNRGRVPPALFEAKIAAGMPSGPRLPPKPKKKIPKALPQSPGPGPMHGYHDDAPGGGILYCIWHIGEDGHVVEDGCVWVVTPDGHMAGSDSKGSDSTR